MMQYRGKSKVKIRKWNVVICAPGKPTGRNTSILESSIRSHSNQRKPRESELKISGRAHAIFELVGDLEVWMGYDEDDRGRKFARGR